MTTTLQTCPCSEDRNPTTSLRSIANSVGSVEGGNNGRYKGPTLHAPRLTVPPGQLVGICGEVGPRCLLLLCFMSPLKGFACRAALPRTMRLPVAMLAQP